MSKENNLALELLESEYSYNNMVFNFSHYCDSMIFYRCEYHAKGLEIVIRFNPDEFYAIHESMTLDHEILLDEGISSFSYSVYEVKKNEVTIK